MHQKLFFLLLLVSSTACKKQIDFPPELRPNEFWVKYAITDEEGFITPFEYQGEDTIRYDNLSGFVAELGYFSYGEIQDSTKSIYAGLNGVLFGRPISVRINAEQPLTDPFTPPEWTPSESTDLLQAGKSLAFGDGPGEVQITLNQCPNNAWSCFSTAQSNQSGQMKIVEVSDYGSPEINIPYFGKKVKLQFSGIFTVNTGVNWTISNGEAVLLFKYYSY